MAPSPFITSLYLVPKPQPKNLGLEIVLVQGRKPLVRYFLADSEPIEDIGGGEGQFRLFVPKTLFEA